MLSTHNNSLTFPFNPHARLCCCSMFNKLNLIYSQSHSWHDWWCDGWMMTLSFMWNLISFWQRAQWELRKVGKFCVLRRVTWRRCGYDREKSVWWRCENTENIKYIFLGKKILIARALSRLVFGENPVGWVPEIKGNWRRANVWRRLAESELLWWIADYVKAAKYGNHEKKERCREKLKTTWELENHCQEEEKICKSMEDSFPDTFFPMVPTLESSESTSSALPFSLLRTETFTSLVGRGLHRMAKASQERNLIHFTNNNK